MSASDSVSDAGEISLSQYKTVRLGLQLIYNSIGVIAGVFLLTIASGISLTLVFGRRGGTIPTEIAFAASGVICLIAILAMIVGFCMMLASPNRSERTLAIFAVACGLLSIGGTLADSILAWVGFIPAWTGRVDAGAAIPLLAIVLGSVSAVCFCLLLRRIGQNISSSLLQKNARFMLVGICIFYSVGIVGVAVMLGPSSFGRFFAVVIAAVALITFFLFLATVKTAINELKPQQSSR